MCNITGKHKSPLLKESFTENKNSIKVKMKRMKPWSSETCLAALQSIEGRRNEGFGGVKPDELGKTTVEEEAAIVK